MAHLHGSPKMVNGSIGPRAAETPRNDCSGLPSSKPLKEKAGAKKPGAGARTHGFGLEQYRNLVKPYVSGTIAPTPPGFVRIRIASFCLETLSNGRCAVIDRAYSVDSATVGAVYDRPICSFETETSYEGLPSLDRMRERL